MFTKCKFISIIASNILIVIGCLLLFFLGLLSCAQRDNPLDPKSTLYKPVPPQLDISIHFDTSKVIKRNADTIRAKAPFSLSIDAIAFDSLSDSTEYIPITFTQIANDSIIKQHTITKNIRVNLRDAGTHILQFEAENAKGEKTIREFFILTAFETLPYVETFTCNAETLTIANTHMVTFTSVIVDSNNIADSLFYFFSPAHTIKRAIPKNTHEIHYRDTVQVPLHSNFETTQKVRFLLKDTFGRRIDTSLTLVYEGRYTQPETDSPIIRRVSASSKIVFVRDQINFNVDAYDPDGEIVTYRWVFGDGYGASLKNTSHHYNAPGDYVVRVCVDDNLEATTCDSIFISVIEPGNTPPKIEHLSVRPNVGDAPLVVTFSVNARDSDGEVIYYLWSFGDGKGATTKIHEVTHTYRFPGIYPVYLVAIDDKWARDTITDTVQVNSSGRIKLGFFADPNPAAIDEEVTLMVVHTDTINHPAEMEYTYTWYLPNDTITTNVNKTTFRFENPGLVELKVKIEKNSGATIPKFFHTILSIKEFKPPHL